MESGAIEKKFMSMLSAELWELINSLPTEPFMFLCNAIYGEWTAKS